MGFYQSCWLGRAFCCRYRRSCWQHTTDSRSPHRAELKNKNNGWRRDGFTLLVCLRNNQSKFLSICSPRFMYWLHIQTLNIRLVAKSGPKYIFSSTKWNKLLTWIQISVSLDSTTQWMTKIESFFLKKLQYYALCYCITSQSSMPIWIIYMESSLHGEISGRELLRAARQGLCAEGTASCIFL